MLAQERCSQPCWSGGYYIRATFQLPIFYIRHLCTFQRRYRRKVKEMVRKENDNGIEKNKQPRPGSTPFPTIPNTGLLPQEPRELWPSFPQDPALCRAPFWHEPALLSHGKRSPPVFFSKKCRGHKIAFPPRKRHFFQAKKR